MESRKPVLFWGLSLLFSFLIVSVSAVSALQQIDNVNRFKAASDEEVSGAIWSHTYGGPLSDLCFDFVEVSTGGFVMTGYKDMNWTADMGTLWIVRTDQDGNELWNRTYTDKWSWGHSILECDDGGFLVAGKLVTDQPQIWLVRTDANGNHLWNRTYGGVQPAVGFVVSEVIQCAEGGYAIFGSGPDSNSGNADYYLVRTDDDGNMLWNYTYNHGWMDTPAEKGLVQCSDGGFAMVGYRRDSVWQPPYSDVWLVRTDRDGNHVWNLTYGGSNAEFPTEILKVDSDLLVFYASVNSEGVSKIIRVDAQGNVVSNRELENIYGLTMIRCSNGGYAIAGAKTDISNEYDTDAYLARADDDFNYVWQQTYNRSRSDAFFAISECSAGGFAMAGLADNDFWLLRVADQAPAIPLEWILVGFGVPIAMVTMVGILRAKRK